MEINSISIPYRSFNEDGVVVVKDHLFVVIDAATVLGDSFHKPTDGVYLLDKLKKGIMNIYKKGKMHPKYFQKQMNILSKRIYRDYIKGIDGELERYQYPNAAIAVCYIDMCDVHFYSIGDTSTFIKFKDGKAKYISDKSIPLMDKEFAEKYTKKGIYKIEDMFEVLRYNRSLLNKNGRRCIFSLYKRPHLKFKHYKCDIRKLNEVYLCSDGYYEAFETFKIFKTRRELFSSNNDLQDVSRKIINEANNDKQSKKYPRIKVIDDITAIKVTF